MKKRILSLLTTLCLVVGLVGVMPTVSAGAYDQIYYNTSKVQQGSNGCNIASIAVVALWSGKLTNVSTAYNDVLQYNGGTYVYNKTLTKYDLAASNDLSISNLYSLLQKGPVIIGEQCGGSTHFATCIGYNGSTSSLSWGGFIIQDTKQKAYRLSDGIQLTSNWITNLADWKQGSTLKNFKYYTGSKPSTGGGSTPTPSLEFWGTEVRDLGSNGATLFTNSNVSGGVIKDWGFKIRKVGDSQWSTYANPGTHNYESTYKTHWFQQWVSGLQSGTDYEFKCYTTVESKYFESSIITFKTTGNPPHTHSYTSKVIAPTCTSQGYTLHTCSCGNSYKDNYKNAIGHSYIDAEIKPTSTNDKGYTIHTCRSCGYNYKDNYVELKNDGYYYASKIPSWANNNNYTVEYKCHSEKIATSSPGSGWVNTGVYKTEYQNVGSPYENYHDALPTSNERVLVSTRYYHFCGPNAGTKVNYELSGNYVHWDSVDGSKVSVASQGTDSTGGMPYYILNWNDGSGRVYCKSGVTCDGSYGSHGNRAYAWYKIYTYQNRTKVTYYKFVKDTGWTTSKDNSANSVEIRFKPKQCTHNYKSKIIAPTCTSQGYTLHTCTKCGNSYKDNYTKKTSHTYGNWITVTSPTCTEHGVKARSCTVCGVGQTSTVNALGHNYTKKTTKPTSTSVGYTVHKCSRCSKSYKDTYKFTKMSGFKSSSVSQSSVKLTWNKVSGATGYIIYKYDNSKKTYVRVTKTTTTANTYTVSKLASGTSYKFAVKPYKTVSGKEVTSSSYPTVTSITKLPTAVNGTTTIGRNSVKLTWKKTTGATGYIIYKYDNSKKTWVRVAKTGSLNYTVKNLKSNTNYKFTVKAYKYVSGKEITSVSFTPISVKTKK